jgi:hypothetical protein
MASTWMTIPDLGVPEEIRLVEFGGGSLDQSGGNLAANVTWMKPKK